MKRPRKNKNGRAHTHDPGLRGYGVVYRKQEKNYCPGCGRTHWWLGRISAECAACGTAIPFVDVQLSGTPMYVRREPGGAFVELE